MNRNLYIRGLMENVSPGNSTWLIRCIIPLFKGVGKVIRLLHNSTLLTHLKLIIRIGMDAVREIKLNSKESKCLL